MKRLISALLLVLPLFSSSINPQFRAEPLAVHPRRLPLANVPDRDASQTLVFGDHFEQSTLDPAKWISCLPWGRENSPELEYYVDDAFDLSTTSHNRIRADAPQMAGHAYTSGAMNSQGLFSAQYGYFEAKAKIPRGKGLWPAFWLLAEGQDWPKEIDVFEFVGDQPDTVYMTNHWKGPGGEHLSDSGYYTGPDFSQAFHTFGVDWQPSRIIWYVDGVERFRTNQGVPTEPMYLIANLAVGGDWPGSPDASTVFPAYLDIDYIPAYQAHGAGTPAKVCLPLVQSSVRD